MVGGYSGYNKKSMLKRILLKRIYVDAQTVIFRKFYRATFKIYRIYRAKQRCVVDNFSKRTKVFLPLLTETAHLRRLGSKTSCEDCPLWGATKLLKRATRLGGPYSLCRPTFSKIRRTISVLIAN